MAHDVADEHPASAVSNWKDTEEITADRGCRQKALGKTKGAVHGRHRTGKGRKLAGLKNFLDFASHVEIGFELGVFGTQFIGVPSELPGHGFALDGIPHGPHQELAFDLAFDEVILCPLVDGLHGELGVIEAAQDDDGHLWGPGVKAGKGLEAVAIGQGQIGENDADAALIKALQAGLEAADVFENEEIPAGPINH